MAGDRGAELTQAETDVAHAIATARTAGQWPLVAPVEELVAWLYAHWYCGIPVDGPAPAGVDLAAPPLPGRLTAVHAAGDRWDDGWRVVQVHRDWLSVERGGVVRVVGPGDYRHRDRLGVPPAVGDTVVACGRITVVDEPTGFWATQRNVEPPAGPHLRVYWNVDAGTVAAVVRALTGALERSGCDYAIKAPGDPAAYGRVDALVLYVPRAEAGAAAPALRTVGQEAGALLGERTPRFTRRLFPGCAWAEDPPGDVSFGWHRCEAVVSGMVAAATRGVVDDATTVDYVLAALEAAGIDPSQPHRNLPVDDVDLGP